MRTVSKTLSVKGSVLAFSLIILSLMLISALSLSVVSVTEKRAVLASDKSNRAFQIADSAVELALYEIYKENRSTLRDVADGMEGDCHNSGSNRGKITGNFGTGSYTITFYNNSGASFNSCGDFREAVVKMKADGTSGSTTRSVEAGIVYDFCRNITGNQTVVPAGCTVTSGNCTGVCL